MRKHLLALCILVLGLFAFAAAAQALDVPPQGGQWVVDNAGLLPAGEKAALNENLSAYATATGNQIVVLTVPSLEGEDVAAYANKVFREWGVGQKDKNNGVLIVVSKAEGKMRFEVGRGIEDKLPDILARRIQQQVTVPLFKQGRFGAGLLESVVAIEKVLGLPEGAQTSDSGVRNGAGTAADSPFAGLTLLLLVVAFVLASMVFGRGNPLFLLMFLLSLLSSIGRGGRGGGGFGGGGFSGGGGDSGGGGSSSDW